MSKRHEHSEIVFASANAGKIRELEELLLPLGMKLRSQADFAIEPVEETASTFIENALLKARHACLQSGLPAIADDSGLEVAALDGAPGLYSSRHAERHGQGAGDEANNRFLLQQLEGLPAAERRARFRSVVVFLRYPLDPSPLIAEGTWTGHILAAPEGKGGFGYDPIFCNDDTGSAASLLDPATKNRLSHRGKAVRAMIDLLAAEE